MELFNVKKTNPSGETDRSNIVSVTVNGAEQCSADGGPSPPMETTAPSGGGCDYPKDNVSWGEYQTKIPMPSSATSPYEVVITFDADTTIGSCHSNCGPISCSGSVCTITYTGSIPMELFNVKKTNPSGETD